MLDLLRESLRKRLVLTVFLAGLIPLGGFSVISLWVPFGREIVYEQHMVFSLCGLPGAKQEKGCTARIELIIGNTGREDENVSVVWPRHEGKWRSHHYVRNISADEPRSRDPVLRCAAEQGRQECIIEQFTPGTMVFMELDCHGCSGRELELLEDTPLEVQTAAHVFYGDPRVTALFRRLQVLSHLF